MSAQQILFKSGGYRLAHNCPFFDPDHDACRAALLAFMPDGRHLFSYCCSDDHDDCPLFLAKALRSSSAGSRVRDAAAHGEK